MQGILSTVFTLMAFTRVIQTLGATVGSMLTAAVPALTTLLAIPLVGETPNPLAMIGIACVTAGIVATLMTFRRTGS
jgi:drug/metabolite transporter (DMT)-like permease